MPRALAKSHEFDDGYLCQKQNEDVKTWSANILKITPPPPHAWVSSGHLSHNQNPVLKSSQNQRIMKPDICTYFWLALPLTNQINPRVWIVDLGVGQKKRGAQVGTPASGSMDKKPAVPLAFLTHLTKAAESRRSGPCGAR